MKARVVVKQAPALLRRHLAAILAPTQTNLQNESTDVTTRCHFGARHNRSCGSFQYHQAGRRVNADADPTRSLPV